jgi:hypothetical protein
MISRMDAEHNEKARAAALVESWRPYFIAAYARDACNLQRQTLDEYLRWVHTYLLVGGSGQAGWLAQSAAILSGVRDAASRQRIDELLQQLGKTIAAEWSKDSACRKIYSTPWQGRPNLIELGRKLQHATRRASGDARELEAMLSSLIADLRAIVPEP